MSAKVRRATGNVSGKINPSSKSNRGATEYSTAHNSLRIIVLLSFSAIVANDVPTHSSLENRSQLSENKAVPR
jgi:hypothetical protein